MVAGPSASARRKRAPICVCFVLHLRATFAAEVGGWPPARLWGVVAGVPVGDVACEPEGVVGCAPVFVTAGTASSSSPKSKRSAPISVARSPTRTYVRGQFKPQAENSCRQRPRGDAGRCRGDAGGNRGSAGLKGTRALGRMREGAAATHSHELVAINAAPRLGAGCDYLQCSLQRLREGAAATTLKGGPP